jgi:hypothetical protein
MFLQYAGGAAFCGYFCGYRAQEKQKNLKKTILYGLNAAVGGSLIAGRDFSGLDAVTFREQGRTKD